MPLNSHMFSPSELQMVLSSGNNGGSQYPAGAVGNNNATQQISTVVEFFKNHAAPQGERIVQLADNENFRKQLIHDIKHGGNFVPQLLAEMQASLHQVAHPVEQAKNRKAALEEELRKLGGIIGTFEKAEANMIMLFNIQNLKPCEEAKNLTEIMIKDLLTMFVDFKQGHGPERMRYVLGYHTLEHLYEVRSKRILYWTLRGVSNHGYAGERRNKRNIQMLIADGVIAERNYPTVSIPFGMDNSMESLLWMVAFHLEIPDHDKFKGFQRRGNMREYCWPDDQDDVVEFARYKHIMSSNRRAAGVSGGMGSDDDGTSNVPPPPAAASSSAPVDPSRKPKRQPGYNVNGDGRTQPPMPTIPEEDDKKPHSQPSAASVGGGGFLFGGNNPGGNNPNSSQAFNAATTMAPGGGGGFGFGSNNTASSMTNPFIFGANNNPSSTTAATGGGGFTLGDNNPNSSSSNNNNPFGQHSSGNGGGGTSGYTGASRASSQQNSSDGEYTENVPGRRKPKRPRTSGPETSG